VIGLVLTYILLFPIFPFLLMIFDGPGSGNSIFTKLLFFSILFFPTSCFMVIILSKSVRYAPLLLNIIALFIGLAGIHFLQGGSFVPR